MAYCVFLCVTPEASDNNMRRQAVALFEYSLEREYVKREFDLPLPVDGSYLVMSVLTPRGTPTLYFVTVELKPSLLYLNNLIYCNRIFFFGFQIKTVMLLTHKNYSKNFTCN